MEPVWTPPVELLERSEMAALAREVGAADYDALWRWSVEDVGRFWTTVAQRYGLRFDGSLEPALGRRAMPGAQWFPNVRLSFPEHVLTGKADDAPALHCRTEDGPLEVWTWARLRGETARVRAGLAARGVGVGDRVAGFLPNRPETVAAFLATTSLGATWSCCSPDFGTRTVLDRFAQIEPKVLLATPGYRYGGKDFDRRPVVEELAAALPTVEHTILLGADWDAAFPPTDEPLAFERVPFDHPLWIVYSSGTTGMPKAIVHGHGGPLLEHLKTWRLHHDARPGDRMLWFTTTGWIMWNYLVCALLSDVSIVLYDGNPGFPDLGSLWDLAQDSEATLLGGGAAFFHGCMKAGLHPAEGRDLSRLRAIGATGSPLAPEAWPWVAEELGDHVWLTSTSGGTDIAGAFLGGSPTVPVWSGELSVRMLGVAVAAWDDDGREVVGEMGELVVTEPMPSMPVGFWGDEDGERYREAYFDEWPGVWRHGDWLTITERGSAVIHGRSDSTINRGGIRIGTAEVYNAVLADPAIADAMAIDLPAEDETKDSTLKLFVVLAEGATLDDELVASVRRRIREDCSPRHVPDEVLEAPALPRTLTGKLLEVPVKKLFLGRDPRANRGSLADPAAFDWFVEHAAQAGARA
jgi:acetoacetyl-CoA synthetase